MNSLEYLEEKVWLILWYATFIILQFLFLLFLKVDISFLVLIVIIYLLLLIVYLVLSYQTTKKKVIAMKKTVDELEEKYLIAEIIKKPKSLENEGYYYALKKACKSMNDKLTALENKYQEYEEYIESFVHEIKTPLSALALTSENKKDKELKKEVDRMNNLVEQVLYYARSETTEKDYFIHQENLEDLIHHALLQKKDYLLSHNIKVETQNLEKIVSTDEKWVIFILSQILDNAIKYMNKRKKEILISAKEEKNQVILIIKDNGCGMKEADLARVFDKGFTGSNRKKEYSTGFGLYLCKKLCDKLNLNIAIKSQENEYTQVFLIFPKSSLHNQ